MTVGAGTQGIRHARACGELCGNNSGTGRTGADSAEPTGVKRATAVWRGPHRGRPHPRGTELATPCEGYG